FSFAVEYRFAVSQFHHRSGIVFNEINALIRITVSLIPWLTCFMNHQCGKLMFAPPDDCRNPDEKFSAIFRVPLTPCFKCLFRSLECCINMALCRLRNMPDGLFLIGWIIGSDLVVCFYMLTADDQRTFDAEVIFSIFQSGFECFFVFLLCKICSWF